MKDPVMEERLPVERPASPPPRTGETPVAPPMHACFPYNCPRLGEGFSLIAGLPENCCAWSTLDPAPGGKHPIPHLYRPVHAAVAGHIKREFQPGPHSQFVEGGAQVVLHHCSLVS